TGSGRSRPGLSPTTARGGGWSTGRGVQGQDLLIEYDTTDDGNHAHTVLRRPRSDFGDDVLAAHYREARGPAQPAQ
ncbi:MAG TPA: DUF3500 domain-containing protein, partial [Streptosporangiaceae bacterium]|nr:DUF3500 domain-containing protein [Streptosporangiaceae bacterium]